MTPFAVITDAEINNYINNALGTAANISMGKILTQKRIAMMFMPEVWNDMRRYDFDNNIFFGWDIPAYHAMSASGMDKIPAGKKQYALSFTLQDVEKTLTDQDVERVMERLLEVFGKEFGATLR